MANEFLHHLKNRKQGKNFELTLKVDMNKVYDKVEWDFLGFVMKKMGFNAKWIGWILEYISSITYDLIVNSKISYTIHPSRY